MNREKGQSDLFAKDIIVFSIIIYNFSDCSKCGFVSSGNKVSILKISEVRVWNHTFPKNSCYLSLL